MGELGGLRVILLHYNYNLQRQIHYTTTTSTPTTTTTTALRHTTSSSCGEVTTATIATHSRKHDSNHLSVHQWIRSAIRDSQQPTAPIGYLFLKLPPPPCAVLLVPIHITHSRVFQYLQSKGLENHLPFILLRFLLLLRVRQNRTEQWARLENANLVPCGALSSRRFLSDIFGAYMFYLDHFESNAKTILQRWPWELEVGWAVDVNIYIIYIYIIFIYIDNI